MPDVLFKDVYGHQRLLEKEGLALLSMHYQHKAPSFLPSLGCQCQAVNNRKLLQLYHLKIKFSIYYTLSTHRLLDIIVVYLTSLCVNWAFFWHAWAILKRSFHSPRVPKKVQFTQERVEYNVFLFDEPLKGSKSLKTFKISLTFRFDKL
jgi:hypothetical protein